MLILLLDNLLLIILSLEQDCLFVSATWCLSLIRTCDICGRYSGCVFSFENGHCSMMLSTFPPLCLSPIDHTDFFFVQLAYVLKLYGLLRFQLVVVDLNWVALITTRCCQTVDLLMSKVGPSLDPLEQQEAKNHQVVEAHTYHSEPFHKELPHTRISTGTHM